MRDVSAIKKKKNPFAQKSYSDIACIYMHDCQVCFMQEEASMPLGHCHLY